LRALILAGRYQPGLARARALVEHTEATAYLPLQAEAHYELGRLRKRTGDLTGAEASLTTAIQLASAARSLEQEAHSWLELLAVVGHEQARTAEGAATLRAAAAAVERAGGSDALRARLAMRRATMAYVQNEFEDALTAYREARSLYRRSGDALSAATAQTNLSLTLSQLGRPEEALEQSRVALADAERILGPDHPEVAYDVTTLAIAYEYLSRNEEALPLYERAVSIRERALGANDLSLVQSLLGLGWVEARLGRYQAAIDHTRRALKIVKNALEDDHPRVASAMNALGGVLAMAGETQEALGYLERAAERYASRQGEDSIDYGMALLDVGLAELRRGNCARALDRCEAARKILATKGPAADRFRVGLDACLGQAYLEAGKVRIALPYLERAVSALKPGAADLIDAGRLQFALARARWSTGVDRASACSLAQDALKSTRLVDQASDLAHARIREWVRTRCTPPASPGR
jgi:tetratricopeptide (TPR) repeat protein